MKKGEGVRILRQGMWHNQPPDSGILPIEGPRFPEACTWYAHVEVENGKVIKVL